jgi:hypothetical protein
VILYLNDPKIPSKCFYFCKNFGKIAGYKINIKKSGRAPVARACNPSYLGGRDQEDRS